MGITESSKSIVFYKININLQMLVKNVSIRDKKSVLELFKDMDLNRCRLMPNNLTINNMLKARKYAFSSSICSH